MKHITIIALALVAGAMLLGCEQATPATPAPAAGGPTGGPGGGDAGGDAGGDGGQDETPTPKEPEYEAPSFPKESHTVTGFTAGTLGGANLPVATGSLTLTYSFKWTGPAAPGITFNPNSQRLGGTPTTAGRYAGTYRVDDGRNHDTMSVHLTVAPAPPNVCDDIQGAWYRPKNTHPQYPLYVYSHIITMTVTGRRVSWDSGGGLPPLVWQIQNCATRSLVGQSVDSLSVFDSTVYITVGAAQLTAGWAGRGETPDNYYTFRR